MRRYGTPMFFFGALFVWFLVLFIKDQSGWHGVYVGWWGAIFFTQLLDWWFDKRNGRLL